MEAWIRRNGDKPAPQHHRVPEAVLEQFDGAAKEVIRRAVEAKESVFFTGKAGTGKTTILTNIIEALRQNGVKVAVCSATGIGAEVLGGSTIHAFAGLGADTQSASQAIQKIMEADTSQVRIHIQNHEVLVIDDIHRLHPRDLRKLNLICQYTRGCLQMLGGMQFIATGDFYQLPPHDYFGSSAKFPGMGRYTFDLAIKWDRYFDFQIALETVYRHTDRSFLDLLNTIRIQHHTYSEEQKQIWGSLYNTRFSAIEASDAIHLFASRSDAKLFNIKQLDKLPGSDVTFQALELISDNEKYRKIYKRSFDQMTPYQTLKLKRGAKVMIIQNGPPATYKNGTIGKILGFITADEYRSLAPDDIPSFFSELEQAERATTGVMCSSVVKLSEYFSPDFEDNIWPLVEYLVDNCSTHVMLAYPRAFEVDATSANAMLERERTEREEWYMNLNLPVPIPQATAVQVPVIPSYGLTIHKAGGQEFSTVVLHLDSFRSKPRPSVLYSAMTRVRNPEDILLTGKKYSSPLLLTAPVSSVKIFMKNLGNFDHISGTCLAEWRRHHSRLEIPPLDLTKIEGDLTRCQRFLKSTDE